MKKSLAVGNVAPCSWRGIRGDSKDIPQSYLNQGREMRVWPLGAGRQPSTKSPLKGPQGGAEWGGKRRRAGAGIQPWGYT